MTLRNIYTLFLTGSALALTSCKSAPEQDFDRMTFPELMAYNRTVEPMDQVYCVEEIRTGSHIRRRHCETLIQIQERVAKSASAINILGTAQIY